MCLLPSPQQYSCEFLFLLPNHQQYLLNSLYFCYPAPCNMYDDPFFFCYTTTSNIHGIICISVTKPLTTRMEINIFLLPNHHQCISVAQP